MIDNRKIFDCIPFYQSNLLFEFVLVEPQWRELDLPYIDKDTQSLSYQTSHFLSGESVEIESCITMTKREK